MTVDDVARDLRVEPWHWSKRQELERYAEDRGDEALARQVELGKTHFRCCWNPRDQGHHAACPVHE